MVLHRLVWGKTLKIFLCEFRSHRHFIFGMSLYQNHILCEVSVLPNQFKLNSIPSYCGIQRPKVFQTVLATTPICLVL